MKVDRMKLSAQTVRDNIAIMKECEEPDDAGYYLQLEHEKFVLECIEKQIPKKPSRTDKTRCIHCACVVNRDERFCKNCGQALDWSDSE